MQYSEDPEQIRKWAPLLIEGREDQPVAATYMEAGTDVNLAEVSRKLIDWLESRMVVPFMWRHVTDLNRRDDVWEVTIKNLTDGTTQRKRANLYLSERVAAPCPSYKRRAG